MMERVFIFDEDVKTRGFLYELISEIGWGVMTVASGSSLLDLLKNERPGLIIISEQSGDLCGFSLVQKIREFDKDVKIIVFYNSQADSRPDAEQLAKQFSISAYLPKKFDDPDIIKNIISVLNQQSFVKPEGIVKHGSILVVDDELEGRETVANFLRRRGFVTTTASSGEECLEKIKQESFDFVLMDITLTGMDGMLTLKKIKEIHPSVKVIMSSGLANPEIIQQAKAMGASDYLVKPFNFGALEAALVTLSIASGKSPDETK